MYYAWIWGKEWAIFKQSVIIFLFLVIFLSCRLSLSGKRVQARKPPVEARSNRQGSDAPFTEFTHLEEEIFEQEGDYEEIIAIEYKDV